MELDYTIRFYKDIDVILDDKIPFIKTNKKVTYGNIPCTLDIETSSFFSERSNKVAIMYAWALGDYTNIKEGTVDFWISW